MDSTKIFNELAQNYTIGRPIYADSLIDSLYADYGFSDKSTIADIGSGTGKFSSQLLDRKSLVYCVEPNDDMRIIAEAELKACDNFHSVKGTADNTCLEDNSADFITVAQAFHWFDVDAFKKECKRILKPDGRIVLIWNTRNLSADINQKCAEIYKKYCAKFRGFNGGIAHDDERIKRFFDKGYELKEFDNPLYYDKEKFINRCLSSSYSLKPNDAGYDEYMSLFEELFDKYNTDGKLCVPNKSVAYIGKV
ncbi:MAG: class I SAM-dependent methyltransferase [Eubacterium sp.]|nr:class I SAM-dependent methyltransferase [Eubacterium sp.]